jgi:nucleoside-diphosphate-sugar epimerase
MSVFGLGLERLTSALDSAPRARDHAYVESKVDGEYRAQHVSKQLGLELEIVRLGNVWGRASSTWSLPIVQKLLSGRRVAVEGTPGYSNTTDVMNAASYLAHLATSDGAGSDRVGYHHLAEFADVTWLEWITPVADHLGVTPVLGSRADSELPASTKDEVRHALEPIAPREMYRRFSTEKTAGSWTRTLIRGLPPSARRKLRRPDIVVAPQDEIDPYERLYLHIVSGERRFESRVRDDWRPPVTKAESLTRVLGWIDGT